MKKKSKKKSNVNPRTKNQKNKAATANVPDGWLYMSDTEMTAAAIKEVLTDIAYQVEYWEAAQVLEITLGERSSMDVEVIEPCLGEANADAFLEKHQVKFLCYVTFPPEDFEAAKSVMEHICDRIGGFFCGDTEDFIPVIKGQR